VKPYYQEMKEGKMKQEHNHGTTSNTDEVFRTFIGCQVKGILRDRNNEGGVVMILVFDCGWGLAFNDNGSHWTENPRDVRMILKRSSDALNETKKELEHILKLAGE